MEVPQKTKNITTSNSTHAYILKEIENTNSKRYMNPNVHSSIIYNKQPKCPTDEWIKRMWDIYVYKRNTTQP